MSPTLKSLIIALGLAAAPFAGAEPPAASHNHSDEARAAHQALRLNNGQKWATDAPLRDGMSAIRAGVEKRLDAAHADRLSAAQYAALGNEITAQVARIVANCKLEPAADAALHVIIADLMAAADVMTGKVKGVAPRTGFVRTVNALDNYGQYFQHAAWVALKH